MEQALRPFVTAGVAILGAGLIAVTFATEPVTGARHVQLPAIQLASNDQVLLDLSPLHSAAAALPASIPNYDQEIAGYNNYFNNFLTADPSEYNTFETLINNEDYPGTISSCLTGGCAINLSDPAVGPALQQLLGEYQLVEANYQTLPYYGPSIDAQARDSIAELQTYLTITGIGSTSTPPPVVPPTDFDFSTDVKQLEELFLGGQDPSSIHTPGDFFNGIEKGLIDAFGLQSALSDPISETDSRLAPLVLVQTGEEILAHENGALSGNYVDQIHELLELGQFGSTAVGGIGTEVIATDPTVLANPGFDVAVGASLIASPTFGLLDDAWTALNPG